MLKLNKLIRCIFLFSVLTQTVYAKTDTTKLVAFKVNNLLQSNMVIQQDKPLRLWGTAPAGDVITLQADWSKKILIVNADEQGNWFGEIKVPKTTAGNFTPHAITIIHKGDNIKLSNVLIGEVWLCAGQSNMDMMVKEVKMLTYHGVLNFEKEIAAANFPDIRLYKVNADFKAMPVWDTKGTWKICSPQTAGDFSGVAYFFGRELFLKLNVPIGLVVSAVPGASTQAFTKREILENDTLLKHTYLDPHLKLLSSQKAVDSMGFFTKVTKPTLIYNAMIHPLLNLSMRGMIWYQGESNNEDKRVTYVPLFRENLADWRQEFGQGDFPFYFVQIAPCINSMDTLHHATALLRETQQSFLDIKNTAIAATMDVGEAHNVHPRDKKTVGERLASDALHNTYHQHDIIYVDPVFSKFSVNGNSVKIMFKNAGPGLNTKDGLAPKHFYLAGDDHIFYPADARIVDGEIITTSSKVAKPVAIRYAFTDAAVTNLQSTDGLPVMPFRTDNWDK